jgi:Putative beta barrel porin-7 (BBP7)
MRKRFHGWILTTVLGGATGALAQDGMDVVAPVVIPTTYLGGTAGDSDIQAADIKAPEVIEVSNQAPAPLPAVPMPPAAPIPLTNDPVPSAPTAAGGEWVDAEFLTLWASQGRAPQFLGGPAHQPNGPVLSGHHIPTSPGFIGLFQSTSQYGSLNASNATSSRGGVEFSEPNVGGKIVLGTWLSPDHSVGVEVGYSYLALSHSSTVGSAGQPELAIPFLDANTGHPTAFPIAQAGVPVVSSTYVNTTPAVFVHLYDNILRDRIAGTANLSVTGDLQDVWANAVVGLVSEPGGRLSLTFGPRFLRLDESLRLTINTADLHNEVNAFDANLGLPGATDVPNDFTSLTTRLDQFDTRNHFYGGQVGARGEVQSGNFVFGFGLGIAVGDMTQTVSIAGENASVTTTTTPPLQTVFLAGIPLLRPSGPVATTTTYTAGPTGLFAQPTNEGTSTRNILAFIPQGNLRLGYRISDSVTASIGYSFMYINDVARPGDQIDYTVHPGTVTYPFASGGVPHPLPQIKGSDFWVQGIELGLQVRY